MNTRKTHSYIDQIKLYAVLKNGFIIELPLIYAQHSEHGNVLPQLLFSDDWRTDMFGAYFNNGESQYIDLKFEVSPNLEVTELMFQIKGYNPLVK